MRTSLSSHCLHQKRIGVDRLALPPVLFRTEFEDREVQVRRIRIGVAGCPDVPDQSPFFTSMPSRQTFGITIEMRVVVGVVLAGSNW